MRDYDQRLDSSDEVTRLRAEVEALTTSLIAANSRHAEEYAALSGKELCARLSHEAQRRNTEAFMRECEALRKQLRERNIEPCC